MLWSVSGWTSPRPAESKVLCILTKAHSVFDLFITVDEDSGAWMEHARCCPAS
jgi:hypothetical protein